MAPEMSATIRQLVKLSSARTWLGRVVMPLAFLAAAGLSAWLHGPLFDSCEPDCSPEYLFRSDLRVQAAWPLVYANAFFLYWLATACAVCAFFWSPLRRRGGVLILIALGLLILLDSWLMRYW